MITWGFVASYGDAITIGKPFTQTVQGHLVTFISSYILVGSSGDLVWLNALGIPQWLPGTLAGQAYPIGASQIVASAIVNGVSRTTTASSLSYLASPSAA
jgi:hypothetical protein